MELCFVQGSFSSIKATDLVEHTVASILHVSDQCCVTLLLHFMHCLKQLKIYIMEADKLNLTQLIGQFP